MGANGLLHFQDPSDPGRTLLDLATEAAVGAEAGGGIFAFASARGIAMLLDDSALGELLGNGSFELVVGTDAVTDQAALDALGERERRSSGLKARTLVHDLPGLFHPKLIWFRSGSELRLIVGSGNLTMGGLTSNVEAFAMVALDGAEAARVTAEIDGWFARWQTNLLTVDHEDASRRVASNTKPERTVLKARPEIQREPTTAAQPAVLVTEVPRNAPGRHQINVSREHFMSFFGGQPGRQKRILLRPVQAGGQVGDVERPRALFETSSHNYRFEAGSDRGREYPRDGRLLAAFARDDEGVFRYLLLWPGDEGYRELADLLRHTVGEPGRQMRRQIADRASVTRFWPGLPL